MASSYPLLVASGSVSSSYPLLVASSSVCVCVWVCVLSFFLQLKKPEWAPDFGPAEFVPSWGATVTGARKFLIAYNVNLLGTKEQAHRIALLIREQGKPTEVRGGREGEGRREEGGREGGRERSIRWRMWWLKQGRKGGAVLVDLLPCTGSIGGKCCDNH